MKIFVYFIFRSGALPGKMSLERIIENYILFIKLMLILGQDGLSKGQLYPEGLGKELGQGSAGLESSAGDRNRKKTPQIIFNNPSSSTKTESAPDPMHFVNNTHDIIF